MTQQVRKCSAYDALPANSSFHQLLSQKFLGCVGFNLQDQFMRFHYRTAACTPDVREGRSPSAVGHIALVFTHVFLLANASRNRQK